MYVLLGAESGDRGLNLEKKTGLVGPIKRIDRKTMEVELRHGEQVDIFRVTEDPECVFELVMPVFASIPEQPSKMKKATGKYKIDFTRAYGVSRSEVWGGIERLGLNGKRIGCMENDCRDFAALGALLDESQSTNERLLIEYFRSKYCPGSPY